MRNIICGICTIPFIVGITFPCAALAQENVQAQLTTNIGFLTDYEVTPSPTKHSDTISGLSFGSTLVIGAAPTPGLFIGGLVDWLYVPSPIINVGPLNIQTFDMVSVGPYIDYYFFHPSSHRRGPHMLMTVGPTAFISPLVAFGGYIGAGIGYDFGGIGLLIKTNYSYVIANFDSITSYENVFTPTVALTVDFN